MRCRDGSWLAATLFFDSEADQSYISSSLVRCVEPRNVGDTEVVFSIYGGSKQAGDCSVFDVSVKGRAGPHDSIRVTEVPFICSPLHRPSIDKTGARFPRG